MIERVLNSCDSHTDDVGKSAAAGGLTDAQAAMKNLETATAYEEFGGRSRVK